VKERYTWIYKLRGILMLPPCILIVVLPFRETEHETLTWTLGMAVFLAGVGVRVWAQTHLHYRLRIRKKLTSTGPYAHVRNPIYLANTAMLLGLTVLSELLWFLPLMLAWCAVVYGFVVRREEAHLLGKYGAPYADYLRAVPRWFPRLADRYATMDARPFLWPSIVAELHCFLWLLPFIGKEVFWSVNGF